MSGWVHAIAATQELSIPEGKRVLETYCISCHGSDKPKGGLNMEKLLASPSVGPFSDEWEAVAELIETGEMPPDDAEAFPTDAEREQTAEWVHSSLKSFELAHAGEPGHVTVRRLTSGEYTYVVRDLTGIDLPIGVDASSDAAGGEGFTNFGDVQFVQDVSIERYLEAAKQVADHAVIGAGPLEFYSHSGKTGLELSALARITELYASKGFRVVSGEGGRPYGLERYGKAFFAAWHFQHRAALGHPNITLRELAAQEGITGRFAEHIWSVVNRANLAYPARDMVALWKALPAPGADADAAIAQARAGCESLYKHLTTWPSWFFSRGDLAAGGLGDESPLAFDDASLAVTAKHHYSYQLGLPAKRERGAPPPTAPGPWKMTLSFDSVNPLPGVQPVVIWRNPRLVSRERMEPMKTSPVPTAAELRAARAHLLSGKIVATDSLRSLLPPAVAEQFGFGRSPDATPMGADDFAATGPVSFEITVPAENRVILFEADVELGTDRDAVVRVVVSDALGNPTRDGDQHVFVGDPASAGYRTFRAGMAEYASLLPPNSHGEANPADKDPVPAPFDNTYNSPEHDAFVLKVKYQRNDQFFTENMVDGADRERLEEAWADLYGSWPYHTAYLGLLADHYGVKLKSPRIEDMDAAAILTLPEAMQPFVVRLRTSFEEVTAQQRRGEKRHVQEALEFASRAWRRPLAAEEKRRLEEFYQRSRTQNSLDHDAAMRALLARVLVSPAFLYRLEGEATPGERPLNDWEMASRLSFLLWSSIPDAELRRAAASGELRHTEGLSQQVKRMSADPKARRFATEFFGQWLGFYRFDDYRGVDTSRFPEFTDDVKRAMYDEAVSTFEYVVRQGRPVREIINADYTFLNQPLAKFYGIDQEIASKDGVVKVDGANAFNRGGVLRLGSVLTTTSAPLRTSPVKRGDWILRRILGTPTPPPPPDAGSLPSDPNSFGKLTLRETLEAHKRNPSCANCHTRIDPMGFPLEGFDAVGRARTEYADGTTVDVTGELPNKAMIVGAEGLLNYLQSKEPQVMKTLAKKVLGYALGRTVQASDRALVDELVAAGGDASFADLITKVVGSRQFRNRQGQAEALADLDAQTSSNVGTVARTSQPN